MAQINGSSSKNGYGFYAVITETIPDDYITTNETIVNYTVYIKNNGTRFNSGGWTKYVKIDGGYVYNQTNQTINSSSVGFNQALAIMSGSTRVKHNDNGSKVITFEACIEKSSYTSYDPGRCYLNGTIQLTTIPRASTVYTFIGNPGYTTTINIKSVSQSFRHTITYNFQGLTGTIGTNIGTSVPWEIPNSFYEKIPTRNGVTGTIYCETFNGSAKIGSTTSTSFTIAPVESDCIPEVLASIGETDEKLMALSNKLIKFVSKPKVVMAAEAKNYATITETKVVCGDGKQGTGSVVILDGVESGDFTITATDSRGYIDTQKMTLDMVPYIKLTFNGEIYRPNQTGSEIKIKFDGNYFAGNFGKADNELGIKFRYKTRYGEWSEYQNITPTINAENDHYSGEVSLGNTYDYKAFYDFEVIAYDKIMEVPFKQDISQGVPIFARFEHFLEAWGHKFYDDDGNLYLPTNTKIYSGDNPIITHNDTTNETVLATNESNIIFRPNGYSSLTNQIYIDKDGNLHLPRMARIFCENTKILTHNSDNNTTVLAGNGTNIIFRPNGGDSSTGQMYINTNGSVNVSNNIFRSGGERFTYSANVVHWGLYRDPNNAKYLACTLTGPMDGVSDWGWNIWASDKRLKNSIKDTKVNALDIIMQMKHREFKYNDSDTLFKIGYVADELQEIDEQLIFEVGDDKLKQPSTSYIIPILSKAIQEQQEYIKKLEKRIESLESCNNLNKML